MLYSILGYKVTKGFLTFLGEYIYRIEMEDGLKWVNSHIETLCLKTGHKLTQRAFTCSTLTIETLGKGNKYVQT